MKKFLAIITLLLVLALSISMFVACGEDENPTEETSETATEQPTETPSDEQPTQTPTEDPSETPSEEDPTEPPVCKHETLETLPAVDATCTDTGLTEGKKCSVCGEITVAQTTVEAKGHNEISIGDAIAPTCTETGITAGKKCSVCNEVTEARASIPALGHTEVEIPAVAPTCTTAGSLSGKKCSVCEVVLIKPQAVSALGHEVVDIPAVAPTCTEEGSTKGEACDICEIIIIAPKKVPMIAHELVAIGEEIKPTCTTTGKTAGEKCANCDYIATPQSEIAKLPHTIVNIGEEIAPTCSATGLTAGEKCSVCQTVITDRVAIPKLPHSEEVIPAVAPTCTESGWTEGTKCSVCDAVITAPVSVEATGHVNTEIKEIPSSCTEAGKKLTLCKDCGTEISSENLPLASHTPVAIGEAIAPTCSATGLTAGEKCDVCGEILKEQEILATIAHTEETIPAIAPTCTEAGFGEGTQCSVCGDILRAPEMIPATGHINTTETVIDATCTSEGEKKVICDCGYVVSSEIIVKIPHTAEEFGEAIAPTCTEMGKTTGVKCSVCDTVIDEQEDIPALGHTWTELEGLNATCTESGLEVGHKCTVCGVIEQNVIPALGHSASAAWSSDEAEHWQICIRCSIEIEDSRDAHTEGDKCTICGYGCDHINTTSETKNPTCTAAGSTIVTCSDCGAVVSETTIDALGHTEEVIPAVEATCTEAGLTAGKKCSVCGTVIVAQKEVLAKGHSNNSWVVVVPSTCTSEGSAKQVCGVCGQDTGITKVTDKAEHDTAVQTIPSTCTVAGSEKAVCKDCGYVVSSKTLDLAPHTEIAIGEAIAPTCTTTGKTAGKKCSVCDKVIEAQATIPSVAHTEEEIPAVEPTCTTTGKTAGKKCSVCGAITVAQTTVPMTDHNTETVTVPSTCTTQGTEKVVCKDCGYEASSKTLDLAPHTEIAIGDYVAPTCTSAGLTAGKKCSVCGKILEAQATIPTVDHTEIEIPAVAPTCTESGKTSGTKCSVCDTVISAPANVPATGHTEVDVPAKEATCTENGNTAGKQCTVCGVFTTEVTTIPAKGHTDETLAAVAPTCTETGLTEGKKCSVCGEITVAQEEIPAKGHTDETLAAKAPTCTETGLTEGKKCAVCGEITVAQETVAATGHTYSGDCDADCNTCGDARETAADHTDGDGNDTCDVCGASVIVADTNIYHLVGNSNYGGDLANSGWNADATDVLTMTKDANANIFTIAGVKMYAGDAFKIVGGKGWNTQANAYNLAANETGALVGSGENITVAEGHDGIYTITFNSDTWQITYEKTGTLDAIAGEKAYYVVGAFADANFTIKEGITPKFEGEGEVLTAVITTTTDSFEYKVGYGADGNQPEGWYPDGANLVLATAGKYTISFNTVSGQVVATPDGEEIPDITIKDDWYIAGSMNGWGANEDYKLTTEDSATWTITLDLAKGDEFKVHNPSDNSWFPSSNYSVVATGSYTVTFVKETSAVSVAINLSTPQEIVDAAYELDSYKALPGTFTLTGVISKVDYAYTSSNNNITVTMDVVDADNSIQCYKLTGDGIDEINVGDTITATGTIKNYNGTVEFDQGCTLDSYTKHECTYEELPAKCDICGAVKADHTEHVDGDGDEFCDACGAATVIQELTITEANALGATQAHNTYTTDKYYVSGVITEVQSTMFGNCVIKDATGATILVYGLYSEDGEVRYDAMETKPAVGDTIKVLSAVGQYSNNPQLKDAWLIEHTPHTECEYEFDCSTKCSVCGKTREAAANHTYDDLCADTECNVCGETRRALVCVDTDGNSKCDVCGKDYSAPVGPTYQVATSVSVGDKIILTGAKTDGSTYEFTGLSGTSGKVNGLATKYTTDDPSGTFVLEVVAGSAEGSVAFKTLDGIYLAAVNENKISIATSVDATSSWTVTFDDNGLAVITNVSLTNRELQFNANNSQERFCAYKGTQKSLTIFKINA